MATIQNNDHTINFLYFISNYPSGFIFEVWAGSIAKHLSDKFSSYANRHQRTDLAFLLWFYELDTENKNILLTWVNQNYKSFSHLKL